MADDEINAEIVFRKEARENGLQSYFTGKPCKWGHISPRETRNGCCKRCKYLRDAASRMADPAAHNEKVKRYYRRNSEVIKVKRRAYHYETYTDIVVRERAQARTRHWALENPQKAKANHRNGKAKRRNVHGVHTAEDIADIFKAQRGRCAYCRNKLGAYEIDHIMPVAKGGTNDRRNIQLTCAKCNRTKSAREPEFHARTLGMLI